MLWYRYRRWVYESTMLPVVRTATVDLSWLSNELETCEPSEITATCADIIPSIQAMMNFKNVESSH